MQINEQILFAQPTAFVVGNWSIGLWIKFMQTLKIQEQSFHSSFMGAWFE